MIHKKDTCFVFHPQSLIQRHQQITEEITAFNDDMLTLQEECKQIEENDNQTEISPKEVRLKSIFGDRPLYG